MINRRLFMMTTATIPLVPVWVRANGNLSAALETSPFIYLAPILADGGESQCQAEVWFVVYKSDIYVVTASDAWRAQALQRGLTTARIWVGDFGVWTRSKRAYKTAPTVDGIGNIVEDSTIHAQILDIFGRKYASDWPTWGPRFKNALADGSRVMLKYVRPS